MQGIQEHGAKGGGSLDFVDCAARVAVRSARLRSAACAYLCVASMLKESCSIDRVPVDSGLYVGARFGTCLSFPPGVALSSGADCSAPGISPRPLR
eukprot:4655268-Prymnesium_polylepis.1